MGKLQPSSYYDHIYRTNKSYHRDAKDAPWYATWAFVAESIGDSDRVVDFGCGPGHLAQILAERSHAEYTGVDFSPVALEAARLRAPRYPFVLEELPGCVPALVARYRPDVAVFCEVLEHIEQDLESLRALPDGTRVLATVPSFDDPGHVRVFENERVVLERYRSVLSIAQVKPIGGGRFGIIAQRTS